MAVVNIRAIREDGEFHAKGIVPPKNNNPCLHEFDQCSCCGNIFTGICA